MAHLHAESLFSNVGGQVREWLKARPHDFSTSVINMGSILKKIESKQLHFTWYMLTMPLMFVSLVLEASL